jgi:hypothetical protein
MAARKRTSTAAAPSAARIDASSINVLGKAKDAKRLTSYAAQEGTASLALLEQAFTKGSKPVRTAAARALAVVNPARGEMLSREALERLLAKKRPLPRDLKAVLSCLAAQRTPFAIERVLEVSLERGVALVHLDDEARQILVRALVDRVGARSLEDAAAFFNAAQDVASACAFFVRVLDDDKRPLRDRREAAAALAALGDEASLAALLARATSSTEIPAPVSTDRADRADRADGADRAVVFDLALRVLLRIDAAAAFDKLAPSFKNDVRARATIADEIGPRADKRWRTLALQMLVLDPRHSMLVLARLGAIDNVLAVARRPQVDEIVRHALHALAAVHDRRAVPLVLGWLQRDEGETHAPTLLAALAECAALEDIPHIEALVLRAERADFYTACVERVRERASALT